MSILTEYLNLIPKALGNPQEVMEGWLNVVKMEVGSLPQDQVEEILRRRLLCGACPFMSENAFNETTYKDVMGVNYSSKRKDHHCTLCACPIKSKTASLEATCGAQYWNETNPTKLLEVKWMPYESN